MPQQYTNLKYTSHSTNIRNFQILAQCDCKDPAAVGVSDWPGCIGKAKLPPMDMKIVPANKSRNKYVNITRCYQATKTLTSFEFNNHSLPPKSHYFNSPAFRVWTITLPLPYIWNPQVVALGLTWRVTLNLTRALNKMANQGIFFFVEC